ncbi:Vps71p KNAG_0B03500 [Huiozyma naganishii CBS 8797]|uniref:HIT-type domain-containing protein n=1 Tax=Huiozyma naganishii (strain ATCC MYA-139 / BCRC 22969 / CBS 8797 / KCTC 17520 / NBRC 10181 / NCYC 3082 / Yp74L-3) TaxID=1071383 RepID=J7RV62_HUIN7|nr:hypothetical protein KNAG_0B03500 [Kazachstania naganishii CBS 8797]CCK68792.1 hypothetical protein KNAG_0B03500 [Kazachstania naganishii CBS 8797]
MRNSLVEEIDKKTYNPNVYYTTADPQSRSYRPKNGISKNATSQYRSVKRINYSLADMEAKLYTQKKETGQTDENTGMKGSTLEALEKFTPQQIIQSKRRFMELDTENLQDLSDIPSLLSSLTGMNKDKIDSNTTTITNADSDAASRANRNKYEIPKMQVSYRSTKPPKPKKKNTNRIASLKKIMLTKRPLNTYLDMMNQVDRSIILQNLSNKKYFKVLSLITICSICGGFDSISGCVKCGDKICSLNCFTLHNETRCTQR